MLTLLITLLFVFFVLGSICPLLVTDEMKDIVILSGEETSHV
jgi:hypothetical protein